MSGATGQLRLPADVRFGWGSRTAIPELAAAMGRRVFVVTDAFLARTDAFVALLDELRLTGVDVAVHVDVPVELPVDAVHRSGEIARAFGPDVVLGYGGGSALDAAKLVALLCAHGGRLSDYYGENAVPGPVVPLLAVPTTAGTGSEVTPVAVISDPDRALKVGVSSPHLIPRVAVVDPELTVGAPRGVTTHAGIDAFVHAVESFTARDLAPEPRAVMPVFVGRNELTDPLSLEAASLIHRALPRVVADGGDVSARIDMARGSLFAGMAFGAAGTHLSHAIQYPVGAMTHTPHGLGTGTLLPYVLEACAPAVPERLARLGEALGLPAAGTQLEGARAAVDEVAALCARIGLPLSLAEMGIVEADIDRIVVLTMQVTRLVSIAPMAADAASIRSIVTAAVVGDRRRLRDTPIVLEKEVAS
jgi:alcohol dehydrogenase class IV